MTNRERFLSWGVIVVLVVGLVFAFTNSGSVGAQTTPPLDDTEFIFRSEDYAGGALIQVTLIGRSTVDGSIWTVILDGSLVELENRPSSVTEQTTYIQIEKSENVQAAIDDLNIDPQPGQKYRQWVTNRSAELLTCETDMVNGQLMDFGTLGNGAKTATIRRVEECIELNSFVLRKVISNLLDILVAEGLLSE